MESGVEVTIVSWMPDKIRFGSSNYRMQLLEEMRQSGFYLSVLTIPFWETGCCQY